MVGRRLASSARGRYVIRGIHDGSRRVSVLERGIRSLFRTDSRELLQVFHLGSASPETGGHRSHRHRCECFSPPGPVADNGAAPRTERDRLGGRTDADRIALRIHSRSSSHVRLGRRRTEVAICPKRRHDDGQPGGLESGSGHPRTNCERCPNRVDTPRCPRPTGVPVWHCRVALRLELRRVGRPVQLP